MNPRTSWPLALSYAGFFLPAGVLLSYLPPFLAGKGLTAAQVGLVFSTVFVAKLVMGPLLAWWGDVARQQRGLLTLAAWACLACAMLLALSTRFEALLLAVIGMAICRNHFQCMLEALATRLKNAGGAPRYGLMRGIGSAAVCLGVLLFGGLWSASATYQQVALPVMAGLSGFVLIASLRAVSAATMTTEATTAKPERTWPRGAGRAHAASTALLLLGATLMIGANGVFYSTATLLMTQQGLAPAGIAALWCLAFGLEAIGFAAFERLRSRLGSSLFFLTVVALALLRWCLLAGGVETSGLALAFALHVASFSWLHALFAQWTRDTTSAHYAVTAQAVYIACAHGIGMAAAAYSASLLLPDLGHSVYWIAAVMTLGGALVICLRAALGARLGSQRDQIP